MKSFLIFIINILLVTSCTYVKPDNTKINEVDSLKTFGTMGKELKTLKRYKEEELFNYQGKGCITHMWFGGSFEILGFTNIRFYVDGELEPSIDMEMYLGHGIGFKDQYAPWGTLEA